MVIPRQLKMTGISYTLRHRLQQQYGGSGRGLSTHNGYI